jgi:predicted DNA-binding transcriptional regulator AlpA
MANRTDDTLRETSGWYEKAVEAARRIEPVHTSPWKRASTYALLSIAQSLLARPQQRQPGPESVRHVGHQHGELLTIAEVAEMTRLSVGTLRYWRHVGTEGPASFKLGRRVMYRRADVEKWLQEK